MIGAATSIILYKNFSRTRIENKDRFVSLAKRNSARVDQTRSFHGMNLSRSFCIFLILLALFTISPVSAGTKFMTGSPDLSAHIAGTNEFTPGDDVSLPVVIENNGLNQYLIVQSGLLTPTDQSNTAKQLVATLGAGEAPLAVKADPQVIGDLPASSSTTASFHITVNEYAPAGVYELPVTLNYTYLYMATQDGTQVLTYSYKTVNETVTIPITIKSEVQVTVPDVETSNMNAGIEGFVILTVKNVGYENGTNAVIRIQQNDQSPIVPTEGSVYVGDFPVGDVVNCTFRATVSSDAQQKTYPMDVVVYYKNTDGDYVNSPIETIGIPIGQKVAFMATPVAANVTPGANAVISYTFTNIGGTTAYNAEARISAVDPFTSNDDTAFLGTMAPGDARTARFDVAVDPSATVKVYGLDSEVIYRDALNNEFTSDPLKVNVNVVTVRSVLAVIPLPLLAILIIAVLAIAGYVIYTKKFKPR